MFIQKEPFSRFSSFDQPAHMGNCASAASADDTTGANGAKCSGNESVDSYTSSKKYQSPILTALRNNNAFRCRQSTRRDVIAALEDMSTEEKEQVLFVESKRMRGRLSPFPEDDLTHYREMTFHIPDDDEYYFKTHDPRSLTTSSSSPRATTRKTVTELVSPVALGQLQGNFAEGSLSVTNLPAFAKIEGRDEGDGVLMKGDLKDDGPMGWTLASFSGGATVDREEFFINEGILESSMKSSRLGRSCSKKKNVSFSCTESSVTIQQPQQVEAGTAD